MTVPLPVTTAVLADAVGTQLVDVVGDLDLRTAERVRERLETALATGPATLVVDLAACPFVDASALGMLLEVHRRAARQGGVLVLRGCSPRVLRLLSLTGLRGVFALEPGAPQGLAG